MGTRSSGTNRQSFVSRGHRYGWLTFGAVMFGFAVAFGVTAFTLSDAPRRVALAVVGLVLTLMSAQFSRACVVVDRATGVVQVRNLVTALVVPLADVEGFEAYMRTAWSWGVGRRFVQLRCQDGSVVPCRGLTANRYGDSLRMARRLNEAAGLGLRAVVPAAKIPDHDRAIAEFARGLGKTPDTLSPAEEHVFDSERTLWLRGPGPTTAHGRDV